MATDPKSTPTDAPPSLSNYLNDRRFQRQLLDMIVKPPTVRHPDKPPTLPSQDPFKNEKKPR